MRKLPLWTQRASLRGKTLGLAEAPMAGPVGEPRTPKYGESRCARCGYHECKGHPKETPVPPAVLAPLACERCQGAPDGCPDCCECCSRYADVCPEHATPAPTLPPWFRVGQRVRIMASGVEASIAAIGISHAALSYENGGGIGGLCWSPDELEPIDEPEAKPAPDLPPLPAGCEWREDPRFPDSPDVIDGSGERVAFMDGGTYHPLPLVCPESQCYPNPYDALAEALGHPQEAGHDRTVWLERRGWRSHDDLLRFHGVARARFSHLLTAETIGGRDLEHEARVLAAEREKARQS